MEQHKGSITSGWGNLDVQVGPYAAGAWDFPYRNAALSSQTVATGADLAATWLQMTQCAAQIDYANLSYSPLAVNSNAVVNTCLAWVGLETTLGSDNPLSDYWAPGDDLDLRVFNLNLKYNPDEGGPASVQFGFYEPFFGYSQDLGHLLASGSSLFTSGVPMSFSGGYWTQARLTSLIGAGIASLDLNGVPTGEPLRHGGAVHAYTSATLMGGGTLQAADMVFGYQETVDQPARALMRTQPVHHENQHNGSHVPDGVFADTPWALWAGQGAAGHLPAPEYYSLM